MISVSPRLDPESLVCDLAYSWRLLNERTGRHDDGIHGRENASSFDASHATHEAIARFFDQAEPVGIKFRHAKHIDHFVAHGDSPPLALFECVWPFLAFRKETTVENNNQLNSTADRSTRWIARGSVAFPVTLRGFA